MTINAFINKNIKPPTPLYLVEWENEEGDICDEQFRNKVNAARFYRECKDNSDNSNVSIYIKQDEEDSYGCWEDYEP